MPCQGALADQALGRWAGVPPSSPAGVNGVPVLVVVPRAIATPHPQPQGPVTPVNHVADRQTSPKYTGPLGANEVHLWTIYGHWLTIAVNDQFGDRLDNVYAGVKVEEYDGGNWRYIFQNMTSNGTYQDPVGVTTDKSPGPANVSRGSAAAMNWPNDATMPITVPSEPLVQEMRIKVGGHELRPVPAIQNRKVTVAVPNIVNITWP